MEIDDRWQCAYGDLLFDSKKFPDAAGMVAKLHEMGFKVRACTATCTCTHPCTRVEP